MSANTENMVYSVSEPSIVAQDVEIEYKSRTGRGNGRSTSVKALDRISFVLEAGESVGLLGSNGSGKSTLMRAITGVEKLKSGSIQTRSRPVLMGVSAAMVPHLTGAKNVELGCLAMGMTKNQAIHAMPGILAMADVGEAINRPFRTYSSGMAARLKFAIGTAVRPDILLIDEALSTGDATFVHRAEERVAEMVNNSGTVVLVSHDASTVQKMCQRGIWLYNGRIVADSDASWVAYQYKIWADYRARKEERKAENIMNYVERHYGRPTIIFDSSLRCN